MMEKDPTPFLQEGDMRHLAESRHGDVPKLREAGEVGYRELYALVLYRLTNLVAALLPLGENAPVNHELLIHQARTAYHEIALLYRRDLLGALKCNEEGCECHRALYNILRFDEMQPNEKTLERVGDLGPDKVECDPEKQRQMESVFRPDLKPMLMDMIEALFSPHPEPEEAPEKDGKIEA